MNIELKLERLKKEVVDTKVSFDAAYAAEADTWDAWVKAKLELEDYKKEQDNEYNRVASIRSQTALSTG